MRASGSCLCGAVRYAVSAPLRPVVACHCTQCRKTSGHHVAATSAPREAVAVTGEVTWYASSGAARRGFCGVCGSSLFWDGPGANLSIFAGTLDGAPALELAGHIFCADKGCYYEIADGLPQAEQDDPGLTTVIPLISGNLESSASHRRSLDSPELGVKRRGNDDGGDARE